MEKGKQSVKQEAWQKRNDLIDEELGCCDKPESGIDYTQFTTLRRGSAFGKQVVFSAAEYDLPKDDTTSEV